MLQTKKDVLTTLQEELAFLELGGYPAVTFLWTIQATPWIPCIARPRRKKRT